MLTYLPFHALGMILFPQHQDWLVVSHVEKVRNPAAIQQFPVPSSLTTNIEDVTTAPLQCIPTTKPALCYGL